MGIDLLMHLLANSFESVGLWGVLEGWRNSIVLFGERKKRGVEQSRREA